MTARSAPNARRSIFVGRERELARLAAALDDVVAGQGNVMAVTGEPGIGKTRLVQALERAADERGVTVHWGRTPETETAAYWPWIRAIRSLLAGVEADQLQPVLRLHADVLLRLFPELSTDGVAPPAPSASDEGAQLRLFDGVTSLVTAAARAQPAVLVIDDLHWADSASLALLRYLAAEIDRVPLLVVVTYRAEEVGLRPALSETLGSLARLAHFEAVELLGLQQETVRTYLRQATGHEPSAGLLSSMVARTQGNPFFLSELAALQTGDTGPTVPATVKAAIEQRLARLSTECNDLLTMAAVVGRSFSPGVLLKLVECDDARLLDLLDEALASGIVDDGDQPGTYQFHHAIVQETLLDRLSAARRARLHGLVGEAMEDLHGDEPERAAELASHFQAAATVEAGYTQQALRYAKRAAECSARQYAWDDAARYYQSCIDLIDGSGEDLGEDIVDLLLALERCRLTASSPAGSGSAVQRALELLVTHQDGRRIADALPLLFTYRLPRDLQVALVEETLRALPTNDHRARAQILASASVFVPFEPARSRPWIAEAKALAEQHNLHDVEPQVVAAEALACNAEGDVDGFIYHKRREWALYHTLGRYELAARALASAAMQAVNQGQAAQILPLADELETYARSVKVESPRFAAFLLRSTSRTSRGDYQTEPDPGPNQRFHIFLVVVTLNAIVRGDLDYALDTIENGRWLPGAEHFRTGFKAWVELERGNIESAHRHWQHHLQVLASRIPTLESATHAAFAERSLMVLFSDKTCEALLRGRGLAQMRLHVVGGKSVDCARGLAALKLGRFDLAEELFRTGQEWAHAERFPVEEGRNLQGLADVTDARGDMTGALAYLERAIPLFERYGARLYLGHATVMRERLLAAGAGQTPRYPAGLSEREVEVLRLLARGLSNAAIAVELTIVPATVASHVSHILNKTGLSNRTEAAGWAIAQDLTE